ncbi:SDR family NAD(P)-dependent oxidoreductase [Paenibacillus taichungensis]|uniref:SDR family NAD(P)-dependent oxidoreductase n=1 Tax=Paenibacillus taichungensis TaxID=484184 RepID=A0ABX2MS68_9BACL|nr:MULTISPECIES: SDR family NAD(P)-dependent oxidoreductase [Paenibacillus]NUU56939.1 SDR family NAD(P)-dependent oxidoreductase [Paenibacillus taichungensis]PIH60261.1 short-chain dehydrogenase [Paenibacillus sp. LK1]
MKTMVIVGAGPGLGFSLAKTFGKRGFRIALVSRTQEKLNQYAEQLNQMGIEAQGFAADITNKMQLSMAFQQIKNTYGTIDVLEFSPHNGNVSVFPVLETTDESVIQLFNNVVIGAINSARQVIPEMTERGEGAILFTSDLSAMSPSPMFGNSGIAMSGLRNYILNLHERLLPMGVFVGHLSISPLIKKGTGFDPDQVAEAWYSLYEKRAEAEETFPKGIMQVLY